MIVVAQPVNSASQAILQPTELITSEGEVRLEQALFEMMEENIKAIVENTFDKELRLYSEANSRLTWMIMQSITAVIEDKTSISVAGSLLSLHCKGADAFCYGN